MLIAPAMFIFALPGLTLLGGCSPPAPDLKPEAAIIDQLYVLRPNQAFIDKTTKVLETYGFAVDVYQGDEVTVDFYQQLATHGYKLIIFRVHSGLLGILRDSELKVAEGIWLFSSEAYTTTKYARLQLTEQLQKARIGPGYPWVFAIGSKFIGQSMKGEFTNTVIIMMGCSTFYSDDLAQTFIQKGSSAYLGWDLTVELGYVDEATLTLIQKLCTEQLAIKKAVSETMTEKGPDPFRGAVLKYYPARSGSQTVKKLIK